MKPTEKVLVTDGYLDSLQVSPNIGGLESLGEVRNFLLERVDKPEKWGLMAK